MASLLKKQIFMKKNIMNVALLRCLLENMKELVCVVIATCVVASLFRSDRLCVAASSRYNRIVDCLLFVVIVLSCFCLIAKLRCKLQSVVPRVRLLSYTMILYMLLRCVDKL